MDEPTLANDASFRKKVARMARRICEKEPWYEESVQEALKHLCVREGERPGQTRMWYLTSCRYHLQHYLRHKRRVESHECCDAAFLFDDGDDSLDAPSRAIRDVPCDDTLRSAVCARDTLDYLLSHLTAPAQATLLGFADGQSVEEIALEHNLSHQAISKHRKQIVAAVARLGTEVPLTPTVLTLESISIPVSQGLRAPLRFL